MADVLQFGKEPTSFSVEQALDHARAHGNLDAVIVLARTNEGRLFISCSRMSRAEGGYLAFEGLLYAHAQD